MFESDFDLLTFLGSTLPHGHEKSILCSYKIPIEWQNSTDVRDDPSSFTLETCRAVSPSSSWLSSSILPFLPWSFPKALPSWQRGPPIPCGGAVGPGMGQPGLTPQRIPAALGIRIHTPVFQSLWSCCKLWIISQESYGWYTKLDKLPLHRY